MKLMKEIRRQIWNGDMAAIHRLYNLGEWQVQTA